MRWVNIAALTLFISTPAFAGWQWTTWGMTPGQVAAGAPVKVGPYADAKLDTASLRTEMVTNHHTGAFDFSAALLFDRRSQGLAEVKLLLKDADGTQCSALTGELGRVYGLPEAAGPMGYRRWIDEQGGNMISLQPIDGCWLVYEPIPTRESSGL